MSDSKILMLTPETFEGAHPRLTGFAFTPGAVISGSGGLRAYLAAGGCRDGAEFEDGRFFAVLEAGGEVRAFTDPMGQDALYYYSNEDPFHGPVEDWLISNSVYELAKQAKAAGKPVKFLSHIAASHFISDGAAFGAQLISNQTAIQQIKVLPIGCECRISRQDRTMTIVRTRPGDWLTRADDDYAELMEHFVIKTCARILALAESGRYDIMADLTGGHDSRAIFGMTQRAGVADRIRYFSNPARPDDFRSASLVSAAYGRSLITQPHVEVFDEPEELYALWKQACLGVYTSIYAGSVQENQGRLRLHGGNFLSKEFGEKPARVRAESTRRFMPDKQIADRVARAFMQSFGQIGIDPDHTWAMQLHYLNFRGRFHYGRNWFGNGRTPHLTPLISQHFARAAFKLSPHDYNTLRPCMDLLLALDNQLGLIPFDLPEKCFPTEALETSPFWRKPLGFRPQDLALPTVFAGEPVVPSEGSARRLVSLREMVRGDLARYVPIARTTKLFSANYIRAAKDDLNKTGSFPHNARKAAHIITAGTLKGLE